NFKRRGAAALAVVLLAAPVTGGQTVPARDTLRFFGTWRLVSDTQTGMMIYDSLGNMAAQVMPNRARRQYAAADPTPEEAQDAITGYLAYFGTYSVDEQAHIITHHRTGNINPGRLATTSSGPTCSNRMIGLSSPLQGVRTRSCGSGHDNLSRCL